MYLSIRNAGILLGLAAVVGIAPLKAETLTFHAALDGKYGSEPTDSPATGKAKIRIDTKRQTISVDLDVDGITPDRLWDKLVAAPIGPIHLHKYATSSGGDSVLVVPLPYGSNYKALKNGMRVTTEHYPYATGAALLKSGLTFNDFVAAMRGGLIVLNIHTDAFNPGEISGRVGGGTAPEHPAAPHNH
jgi:hypothetical protein